MNIPEPAPSSTSERRCAGCGGPLTGAQQKWCQPSCREHGRPPRPPRDRRGRKKKQYPDTRVRSRTGRIKAKPVRKVAGIDGETVDNRYVMLVCASDDDSPPRVVENRQGLSTAECLRFIARLPSDVAVWGFSFRYDVNMILRDLTRDDVLKLHTEKFLRWHSFTIRYEGHQLTVTEYTRDGRDAKGNTRRVKVASHTVWDAYPWLQRSFVRWLEDWDLTTAAVLDRIKEMKDQRPYFTAAEWKQIRRYCTDECRLMAKGVRRLLDLIDGTGLRPTKFHSPASLSKARFRREGVEQFMADPPPALAPTIEAAYFGGRAEVAEIGLLDGPFYAYDLNSAYPAQAVNLPCLAHGSWVHGEDDGIRLCHVSWDSGRKPVTWGPFPVRPRSGSIRYPKTGKGWYWGVEVEAARRHTKLTVNDCWTFVPHCEHRPFSYMTAVYEQRKQLQAAGDPSEYILKLDLNASYGALAEHPHMRNGKLEVSRWHNITWAGLITAGVRAQLLDVMSDDIVFLAVDCAVSRVPLHLPGGTGLGAWGHDPDADVFDRMLVFGTGQYFASTHGEWNRKAKTRGFDSRDVKRDELLAVWDREGRNGVYKFRTDRFIGMGTALRKVCDRWPPWQWRKIVKVPIAKKFDMTPRRMWRNPDDAWDGRMVAPTNAEHKALERADRALLADLEAEYHRLCDIAEKPKRVPKGWHPEAMAHADEVLGERLDSHLHQRILLTAQQIIFLQSDGELWDREEDAWQGG